MSMLDRPRDAPFPVVLPGTSSDYLTVFRPPYILDDRYKWQVGLVEFSYSNTVFAIRAGKNMLTLRSRLHSAINEDNVTLTPVEIPATEYDTPQAFLDAFNTAITAAIAGENAATFPSDASLVLSYDTATHLFSLVPTHVGFTINVVDGSDLLKMMGQADNYYALRDIYVPIQDVTKVALDITASPLMKPYKSFIAALYADTVGTTTDITLTVVTGTSTPGGTTLVTYPATVNLKLTSSDNPTTVLELFGILNKRIEDAINAIRLKYSSSTQNTVTFSLTNLTATEIRITNTGVSIPATSSLLISLLGIPDTIMTTTASGMKALTYPAERTTVERVWTSPWKCPVALYQRVVSDQFSTTNRFHAEVIVDNYSRKFEFVVDASTDYKSMTTFAKAMNDAMKAQTAFQAALTQVKGSATFTYTIASGTTPASLSVTLFRCTLYAFNTDGADIIRFLGFPATQTTWQSHGADFLGWVPEIDFPITTPLLCVSKNLYVYLPGLICDTSVGGFETALVRCVQMQGKKDTTQTFEPVNVQWLNLAPSASRIDRITVNIRNWFHELVEFHTGPTVTLMFRPVEWDI